MQGPAARPARTAAHPNLTYSTIIPAGATVALVAGQRAAMGAGPGSARPARSSASARRYAAAGGGDVRRPAGRTSTPCQLPAEEARGVEVGRAPTGFAALCCKQRPAGMSCVTKLLHAPAAHEPPRARQWAQSRAPAQWGRCTAPVTPPLPFWRTRRTAQWRDMDVPLSLRQLRLRWRPQCRQHTAGARRAARHVHCAAEAQLSGALRARGAQV